MAITRVSAARRNGTAAVKYAMNDMAKNKKSGQKRALVATGLNVDPAYAAEQMHATRDAHGKADGFVQAYRIVQSFSDKELNPKNRNAAHRANELGMALAEELFEGHEVIVVTQNDGIGGKLHNHIIVNAVSFVDGKSLRGMSTHHETVSKASDAILERYGMKVTERGVDVGKAKRSVAELRMAADGEYVWKDDLRERIGTALADGSVTSQDAFKEKLADDGVSLKYRGENVTFEFEDEDGKKRKSRGKTLGTDYDVQAIADALEANIAATETQAAADAEAARIAAEVARIKKEKDDEAKAKAEAERKAAEEAVERERRERLEQEIRGLVKPGSQQYASDAEVQDEYERLNKERLGKLGAGLRNDKTYTKKDNAFTAMSKFYDAKRRGMTISEAAQAGPDTSSAAEPSGPSGPSA